MAHPADEIRDWLVPIYNAVLVFEEATRQGVNARELIRGTGFSLADLRNSETLKSYDQNLALIDNALRLCPLPGLGLRIGREESPTQWGILGYAIMCSNTLRDMIAMLLRYHRVAASLAEFYFREEGNLAILEARPPRAIHNTLPFVVEEHFSSVLSVAKKLTDRADLRPVEVNLSYPKPRYSGMYREIFGCPVRFNRPSNTLVFDRKWLMSPTKYSSSLSSQMAERICEIQLRRQYIEHDLVHRVRYLLLEHADAFPSAEDYRGYSADDVAHATQPPRRAGNLLSSDSRRFASPACARLSGKVRSIARGNQRPRGLHRSRVTFGVPSRSGPEPLRPTSAAPTSFRN